MLHSSLRDLRYLRENTHVRVLNLYCSNETPMYPADLADLRRRNPKQQNCYNYPTCISLRNNAACCIPLRDLRNLRENTRKSTQSICTKKPQCLPQISLIYADKPQNNINLSIFSKNHVKINRFIKNHCF